MTVKFEDNTEAVKKAMVLLEKKALQETAKIVRKAVRAAVPVDERVLQKNIGTWVRRRGGLTWLQIGVYNKARANKRGYIYAYHAHLVHFGTVKTKATPYLSRTVRAAIPEIRAKQAQFLSYLSDEAAALNRQAGEDEVIEDG